MSVIDVALCYSYLFMYENKSQLSVCEIFASIDCCTDLVKRYRTKQSKVMVGRSQRSSKCNQFGTNLIIEL